MFKNLLQIYSLLVCLIAVVVMMVGFSIALNGLGDLLLTEIKNYGTLLDYDDNERYKAREWNEKKLGELKKLSDAELTQKRLEDRKMRVKDIKHLGLQHMIDTVPWVFVVLIFFAVHWRIYRRQR